jgi:hypothetical protein
MNFPLASVLQTPPKIFQPARKNYVSLCKNKFELGNIGTNILKT